MVMKCTLKFPDLENDNPCITLSVTPQNGIEFNDFTLTCILTYMNEGYTSCLVIKGNDPLDTDSRVPICDFIRTIKATVDDFNKPIKLITNYTYEDIMQLNDNTINEILDYINILIADNKFYTKVNNQFVLNKTLF